METKYIIFAALAVLPFIKISGQKAILEKPQENKELQIEFPATQTEYSITSYKNVDFIKINPILLEAPDLNTEIYISNTNRGVIIISSAETNKALKNFSHTLELNPTYYETFSRQDTTIFLSKNYKKPAFDFTKASSINHDYKNAFNYTVDPRTAISLSKGNYRAINVKEPNGYGQLIYDIIVWFPKGIK